MRSPNSPYLEFGFYFRHKSGRESLRHVAETLTNSFGAVPKSAIVSDQAKPSLLRAIDTIDQPVKLQDADDLDRLLSDSTRFVRKVSFDGGTRVVRDAQEFLVVLPIEGAECKDESNVIAIWVEGAAFSRAPNPEISKKEKQVAVLALTAFKRLVCQLRPTYASITVDYGLENPCDLRRDPRSLAFRDFYLDGTEFGVFIEMLKAKFPNSFYDDLNGGLIAITTAAFRLATGDDSVGDDGFELSGFVGRNIGNLMNDLQRK